MEYKIQYMEIGVVELTMYAFLSMFLIGVFMYVKSFYFNNIIDRIEKYTEKLFFGFNKNKNKKTVTKKNLIKSFIESVIKDLVNSYYYSVVIVIIFMIIMVVMNDIEINYKSKMFMLNIFMIIGVFVIFCYLENLKNKRNLGKFKTFFKKNKFRIKVLILIFLLFIFIKAKNEFPIVVMTFIFWRLIILFTFAILCLYFVVLAILKMIKLVILKTLDSKYKEKENLIGAFFITISIIVIAIGYMWIYQGGRNNALRENKFNIIKECDVGENKSQVILFEGNNFYIIAPWIEEYVNVNVLKYSEESISKESIQVSIVYSKEQKQVNKLNKIKEEKEFNGKINFYKYETRNIVIKELDEVWDKTCDVIDMKVNVELFNN